MRVVIAEDLFLLRDGLTRMLEAHGLEITAAVDNGTDLLTALTSDKPDVAVVDVRLPPTFTDEGLRAALAARRDAPSLPVLVLSQYVEQLYARELLASGSGGIAQRLFVTERAVAKHTASIFVKLGLQPSDDDNRRVLAVLAYLGR